jgi:hypothetical protein
MMQQTVERRTAEDAEDGTAGTEDPPASVSEQETPPERREASCEDETPPDPQAVPAEHEADEAAATAPPGADPDAAEQAQDQDQTTAATAPEPASQSVADAGGEVTMPLDAPSPARPDSDEARAAAAKAALAGLVERTRETLARVAELEQGAVQSRFGQGVKAASVVAGAQGRKAGIAAAGLTARGAKRAAELSKDVVWPKAAGLGQRLARRLHPARLAKDGQTVALWGHKLLFDRKIERLMFRPTAAPVKLAVLTLHGGSRTQAHDYRPTPRLVFKWAMSAIADDLRRLGFIDYGAGKGRVLLMASLKPFLSIGGIELARELHDDAMMNIAQFPRSPMRCRNIECLLADATDVMTPDGPAVHYFFNPFSRVAFAEVLNGLVSSYRENPRRLYVVLIDSPDGDLVMRCRVFRRARLPIGSRLKSFLFSPYRIEVYRSIEA